MFGIFVAEESQLFYQNRHSLYSDTQHLVNALKGSLVNKTYSVLTLKTFVLLFASKELRLKNKVSVESRFSET